MAAWLPSLARNASRHAPTRPTSVTSATLCTRACTSSHSSLYTPTGLVKLRSRHVPPPLPATYPWAQLRGRRAFSASSVPLDAATTSTSAAVGDSTALAPADAASLAPPTESATAGGGGGSGGALDSLFEALVPYFNDLPTYFHLSAVHPQHAYALSILLLTVSLRLSLTLPAVLWQRARTRRMAEKALPRWNTLKRVLPVVVMRRCRREGKSYEEYTKVLQAELKAHMRKLLKTFRCQPLPTVLVPLAIQVPLFLVTASLIRHAALQPGSPLVSELLPWWSPPPELAARFSTSAEILRERGLSTEMIQRLTTPSGPSLADRDSTMVGPIVASLVMLANVELSQWARRAGRSDDLEAERERVERKKREADAARVRASVAPGTGTGAGQRKVVVASTTAASGQSPPPPRGGGAQATSKRQVAAEGAADEANEDEGSAALLRRAERELEPLRSRVAGNVMRALSIVFVPMLSVAPGAIVVYCLSTFGFTFAQTIGFTALDRWRARNGASSAAPPSSTLARRRPGRHDDEEDARASAYDEAVSRELGIRVVGAKEAHARPVQTGGGEIGRSTLPREGRGATP